MDSKTTMDFDLTAEQQAVADVVTSVLDRDLGWDALVAGGVTALPVPERLGGDGVGLPEVATVLTEVGRHGAITPALATLGFGVVPLLDLASDEQQDRFLAGVAKGGVLTAALNEPGAALPDRPATTFANGRLSGTKIGVAYAGQADWMIVTTDSAVVVVSPKADGVQLVRTPTSNGSDEYTVTFSDVAVPDADVLAGATAHRVNQLALAVMGAYADGLVAGALRSDRRLRGQPEAIRQAAVDLPDRRRAARGGLHRFAHYRFGGEVGGLATGRGPRRRRRSGRPRVLGDVAGAAGDADSATTCTAAWAWTSPIPCTGTTPRSKT